MKLRKELLDQIEQFLYFIPRRTAERGLDYFESGAVRQLNCITPDHHYSAVVRGGENYQVSLKFSTGKWTAGCSCPVDVCCKHIVAAFLELREQSTPSEFEVIALKAGPRAEVSKRSPKKSRKVVDPVEFFVPQPPRSPLSAKVADHLGRKFSYDESYLIRQIQQFHANARQRPLTEHDLFAMSAQPPVSNNYNYWQRVELWPRFPREDFLFWLFVAWELRRRKVRIPDFLDGVTDLSIIEGEMLAWKREKEIAQWNDWFGKFDEKSNVSEPAVLELRLAVFDTEARLQWRTDPRAPYVDFKQAQAKKVAQYLGEDKLVLAPDSLPIWSAVYNPWSYENWWTFNYKNAASCQRLNRLLRMPLAADRVVTPDGQPMLRSPDSLRLLLRAPEDGKSDYELSLVTADGATPPPFFCVLPGRPALYLTPRGILAGPAAEGFGDGARKTIPAMALETAAGLRFLQAAGVPPPEHLRERIRSERVVVTIACALRPTYEGSLAEDIILKVTAAGPEMEKEKFTLEGWKPEPRDAPSPRSAKAISPGQNSRGIIVTHDRAAQKHFPMVLESCGLKWNSYTGDWFLRLTKKGPEVFVSWLKSLPPEIEILLDKELATLRDAPLAATVSLDVAEAGTDWFDLKIALQVSDTTLTPEEIKILLNARGGYVRLGKKGWRRLQYNFTPEEDEQLARLGLNSKDFSGESQRFHALQLGDDAAKKFLKTEHVEKIQRRVSELKTRVTPPLPANIRAEMRPYQLEGFHFLAYLTANRFGGVLADDMGLGKTLQTLAWLAWLRDQTPESGRPAVKSSLVVCPKSVMDNWRSEAERFYPGLRVRQWRGEPAKELSSARDSADLIVVNYAQLRSLSPSIAELPWLAAILDEAQNIKNPNSLTAQSARALQASHRLALTGTPIENRLLDLWSIFGFSMPGILGNRAHFLRSFDAKDDPHARRRLSARVRPFLLRRTKSQVAKDLPDRVEEDLLCEMEGEQKTLYTAELKRARQIVLGLKSDKQLNQERFNILTSLLRLRQICCHPALVNEKLRSSESAKMNAFEDLIEPLMEEGHKVLIFSQFVTMLDLLRDKVKEREWPHYYLSGETENRGDLVAKFQSHKGGAVFLISLRAGGFGLNLTAASYVVLFDPWWNPAVENQAIDRTHRIGQTTKVMAYRLLTRDSIEQKIRALQKQKAALADDVLGEERFAQSLTIDDLRFLLAE